MTSKTFASVKARAIPVTKLGANWDRPMISFQRMASYLGAEPFQPFRITTAGGRTFEIRHPEMVQLGRSTMTIFTFLSDQPEDAKKRQVEISLLLTESVEPLEAPTRSQGA